MSKPHLVLHTPAKLNLFLEILGKREDGYHELETLMVAVNLYDTVRFREDKSEQTHLACYHADGAALADSSFASADNLVIRAANLLREATSCQQGVAIDLIKRIPTAAGLAGGSSDAAATLAGLNQFWQLGLSHKELAKIATQIGSDVAFFLSPTSAAVCRGRGEIIEPVRFPNPIHHVIVKPVSGLSTKKVYQSFEQQDEIKSVTPLMDYLMKRDNARASMPIYNALQKPAEKLNRELGNIKHEFQNFPCLGHQMSGSGTAYFGLYNTLREARRVAGHFRNRGYQQVFITRSLVS